MKFQILLLAITTAFSCVVSAATDIGHGTLKGIKVYDLGADKSIRIYFNNDVNNENTNCSKVAKVTYNLHDKEFVDRFLSIAMAAYISGKKVRVVSNTNDCEASFIGIQELRF